MITITTKALQTKLVTLADLKVAIVPGDDDDTFLNSLIDRATSFFEGECGRKFARQVITETFNGNGRTTKAMTNFPLVNLGALTWDGTTIATTEYEIFEDGNAGIVFKESLWAETSPVRRLIEINRVPGFGDDDYSLVYTSGYLLPSDNIVTGIAVTSDVSGKTFTRASGKWPLLVDGDKITFGGFVDTTLNVEFTVASRTDLVITTDETPAASEVGTAVTLECQTLPGEIEQAVIEWVSSGFINRSRDMSIKAEKIGDWSITYGGASSFLGSVLNRYKAVF